MKKLLFFLFVGLLCVPLYAQQPTGSVDLQVILRDNQGKPMPNTEIKVINTENGQFVAAKTDAAGQAQLQLKGGHIWQISILKIRDYWKWRIEVGPGNGRSSRTLTYDYKYYERETRPKVDRRKLNLVVEQQKITETSAEADEKNGIVKVAIKRMDKSPLKNYPVAITCYKLRKTFASKTDGLGNAYFKVPIDQEYEVDIDGIESFKYVDLPNRPFGTAWVAFSYEPTVVDETIVNDTVTQRLDADVHGTSGRSLMEFTWMSNNGSTFPNEPIYLSEIGGKKVYKAITDANGKAKFLLPIGKKYMIHGKYQQDIDVVNFSLNHGIGEFWKRQVYNPDPRLQYPENFIPTPDRLILMSFDKFFDKQLPLPKEGDALLTYAKFGNAVNASSEQAILKLGVSGEQFVNGIFSYDHRPVNVAFVLDLSGSMAGGERVENLRVGMEKFIGQMRDKDYVSITVFDSYAKVVFPAEQLGKFREDALHEIRRMDTGGSTNILDGLNKGYEEALKHFKQGQANHLVLLTDGYADNPTEEIVALSKSYNAKGIDCSTVGVGEGYNYALLDLLASQGHGNIELLDSASEILDVFAKSMGASLYPVAENITMEVEYDKHLLFAQLHGFDVLEKKPGKVKMKLRNMYASAAPQLALLKFTLVNPTQEIEKSPVTIRTKFFDIRKQQWVSREEQVFMQWSPATGKLEYLQERSDKKVYAIAIMNQALKVMAEAFVAGDRDLAKKTLDRTVADVKELFPNADDEDVKGLMEELLQYLSILTALK